MARERGRQRQAQAAAPSYDPPTAEAPAYAAPAPEPKRAAVAKREARARDLFATNAGEELHTSAPAQPHAMAPAGDTGLTGQRNENSVLFSLAVLTKDTEARPASLPPSANKEDSGLIDLKALAQKAESMRPMAMGDGDVFHAPLGLTPPPLGAPVGALVNSGGDAPAKSKLPLMIGGGAGVLVLLVLGIVRIGFSAIERAHYFLGGFVEFASTDGRAGGDDDGDGGPLGDRGSDRDRFLRQQRSVRLGRRRDAEEARSGPVAPGSGERQAPLGQRRRRQRRCHADPHADPHAQEERRRLRLQRRPHVPDEVLHPLAVEHGGAPGR